MIVDGNEALIKVLAYDAIKSSGMNILIPYYYQFTERLIQYCPKCKKEEKTADSVNEE